MAETAVGLGAGIFDEVRDRYPQALYLTSTRHPIADGELFCKFKKKITAMQLITYFICLIT